jgi:sugar fermentation stimulation protein A
VGYGTHKSEVKYGDEGSRIDFMLQAEDGLSAILK